MVARSARLVAGCALMGAGIALMVLGGLGLSPWDVLHQGIAKRADLPMGAAGILVGIAVMIAWIPLKQRFGPGTAVNVVVVGGTIDLVLALTEPATGLAVRWALMLGGLVVMAGGTGLYVNAGFGPGPRDGLMTALSTRHGRSIRAVRTSLELSALALGWALGGQVGIGTIVFAVAIGPLVQFFIGWLKLPVPTLTTPAE